MTAGPGKGEPFPAHDKASPSACLSEGVNVMTAGVWLRLMCSTPRSEVSSRDRLCIENTFRNRDSAISLDEGSFGSGTKWANLKNRSIMVSISIFPPYSGSLLMKETCDQRWHGH